MHFQVLHVVVVLCLGVVTLQCDREVVKTIMNCLKHALY
jgi:hypothetical protein